jgi:hypothetical protein
MSKALPTTKYFLHPQYEYNPRMVNHDITVATGVNFGPYGSYDNALGQMLIEKALAKKVFNVWSILDPTIARYQLDKALP